MKQTTDEKLEVAAGEYAQSMKFKKNPDYLYINLVDTFLAGAKWMETEKYYNAEEPDFIRAGGGEVICTLCKKPYKKHNQHSNYNWLNILCDGTLVKL